MKILVRSLLALTAVAALAIAGVAIFAPGQRGDPAYQPSLAKSAYDRNKGPAVCMDHGHYNMHRANGTYAPFKRLLEADGYRVALLGGAFTAGTLEHCDVLVIANAMGAGKPRLFGINLPFPSKGKREDPAFTPAEVAVVSEWVKNGGSLLLIADHYPIGGANKGLAQAFGVSMRGGFTSAPNRDPGASDPTQLSYAGDLIGKHPITAGVTRVVTFTGQSLSGPGTPLLILPKGATDDVREGEGFKTIPADGRNQGLALDFGKGRLVVMAEAAALTAQYEKHAHWGFAANNDNAKFALGILHWLSRKI